MIPKYETGTPDTTVEIFQKCARSSEPLAFSGLLLLSALKKGGHPLVTLRVYPDEGRGF